MHVAFDGGSKAGVGSAGYVIADVYGGEVVRKGLYLGPGVTNNEAESTGVYQALQGLAELQDAGRAGLKANVRVLGDSQLVVRHLLRLYKCSAKPTLYLPIEGTKSLVRKRGWKVAFRYVPRVINGPADDMCRRALAAQQDVLFEEGQVPEDAPPLELDALYEQVASQAKG